MAAEGFYQSKTRVHSNGRSGGLSVTRRNYSTNFVYSVNSDKILPVLEMIKQCLKLNQGSSFLKCCIGKEVFFFDIMDVSAIINKQQRSVKLNGRRNLNQPYPILFQVFFSALWKFRSILKYIWKEGKVIQGIIYFILFFTLKY